MAHPSDVFSWSGVANGNAQTIVVTFDSEGTYTLTATLGCAIGPDCTFPLLGGCVPYGDCWGGCSACYGGCIDCRCQPYVCGDCETCINGSCQCASEANPYQPYCDYGCIGCEIWFAQHSITQECCDQMEWSGGDDPYSYGCLFRTHWDTPGVKEVNVCVPSCGCGSTQVKIVGVNEVAGPRYVCLNNAVGLEAKFYPPGMGVVCDVNWSIVSSPPGSHPSVTPNPVYFGWGVLWGLDKPGDYTVRARAFACAGHQDPGDTNTVTVIEVASLLPDVGTEIDDGDGDPNTKSFVVGIVDPNHEPNVVTVTATPNPGVSEDKLPDCWALAGGDGNSPLFRTVDRTKTGVRTITCYCGSSRKDTKIYVIKVNLTATDLYGTVAEPNEETIGAFIHFNLDNDNSSNNSVGAPKRPGADYLETTNPVTGEDDLKSLTMSLSPSLDFGSIVLTKPASARVWKSDTKGFSNLVLASGSKTWDLSVENQRKEFLSLCSSLCVEGMNIGGGNIVLKYKAPSGTEIHRDTVKYTFIAANCGDQPNTEPRLRPVYDSNGVHVDDFLDQNQRERFKNDNTFPGLVNCEWSITDNRLTQQYNCIAWSVNEPNFWYNPDYIDRFFGNPPNGNGIFEDSDMDAFYQTKKGWSLIISGTDEQKACQAEAMYYSYGVPWNYISNPIPPGPGYHGARKKGCGCGAGKWIMYESKCGGMERIEHVWDQLNGPSYGAPDRFYK